VFLQLPRNSHINLLKFYKMKKTHLVFPVLALLLVSCRKEPDIDQLQDNFAVQTVRQPDANFAGYKTYYMSDTINLKTSVSTDEIWFDAKSKQLTDAVKANMASRGYTLVSKGSSPNLGLGLTAIKDLNAGVIYPGWWYGYWGGCYWGYCSYPPYYGGGGVVYTIPTGTLVLDMIDLKNAVANEKLFVPWSSVMTGGLGNTNNDLALGLEAINQAFTQSPYLKTN
jgi:hypothetical protein